MSYNTHYENIPLFTTSWASNNHSLTPGTWSVQLQESKYRTSQYGENILVTESDSHLVTPFWLEATSNCSIDIQKVVYLHLYSKMIMMARIAQIPDDRLPGQLNFVLWHWTFVGSQCGICFMSPFWHLEFWQTSRFWKKIVSPPYDNDKCSNHYF